jgi:octaprenyl-diphosphate synthase
MDIEAVYEMFAEDLREVERELDKNIHSDVSLIPTVGRYILNCGGKRLRPLILVLSARLCGYRGKDHIVLAAILEFIHTATLLHDDVVDDAKIRRGNSSANTIWGNQASILIGDLFLARSFSLVSHLGDWKILRTLTDATAKLAHGEILDLVKEGDLFCSEEEYLAIVTHKTASLIEAASHLGALLGAVSPEKELALKSFGYSVGIAYQLMDDTLDYTSTEAEFGKTIGQDLKEGKVTLPLIHALRQGAPEDREAIISAIEAEDLTEERLGEVIGLIEKYNGIQYAVARAKGFAQEAKHCLESFAPSEEKNALLAIADYVIERRS